jgi:enoyl-CoA hydratase/carnithine racemase
LCRQEKRNALDAEMCTDLVKAVDEAQTNAEVGCILLSAHGTVFSAGMDLVEAAGPNSADLERIHEDLFTLGGRSLKPIIVCVNGAALGGGLGLAAQGHVVFAGEGATFALTEIRVGLWPFLVYRCVEAAVGPRRALELSLTGRQFDAESALSYGLVHRVAPAAEVGDRSAAAAREIAQASPIAIHNGMRYVCDSRGRSIEEAGRIAAHLRGEIMAGPDFQEGVAAFRQRRDPKWPSLQKSGQQKV